MKFFKLLLQSTCILAIVSLTSAQLQAQDKTSEVTFIRANKYMGSAVNFRVYVDGKLVCKVPNNRYSSQQLSLGTHTVTVEAGGIVLGSKAPAPLQIDVKEGETIYVELASKKGMHGQVLTKASADFLMKKAKAVSHCNGDPE